jgi:hypothetical protein
LHHIDVGSFYFAMLDEFHQHTKVGWELLIKKTADNDKYRHNDMDEDSYVNILNTTSNT